MWKRIISDKNLSSLSSNQTSTCVHEFILENDRLFMDSEHGSCLAKGIILSLNECEHVLYYIQTILLRRVMMETLGSALELRNMLEK